MDEEEAVRSILQPYFDAVKDVFAVFRPPGHGPLSNLRNVVYEVTPDAHDKERHFARTRTDGRLMQFAPEIVDLPPETLVAIIAHEFGHAADLSHPGCWSWPKSGSGESLWVGKSQSGRSHAWRNIFGKSNAKPRNPSDDKVSASNWMIAWRDRSDDQVEWAADAIAFSVTGIRIGYCGRCMLQCFGGSERPAGLR